MLTDRMIGQMRLTINESLPDQIEIQKLNRVYDDAGGYIEGWTTVDTVPARVGLPLGGETDERAGSSTRLIDEDLYTIWLPAETDLDEVDRVVWAGRTFEINLVLMRGNWELTRRIRVKEL